MPKTNVTHDEHGRELSRVTRCNVCQWTTSQRPLNGLLKRINVNIERTTTNKSVNTRGPVTAYWHSLCVSTPTFRCNSCVAVLYKIRCPVGKMSFSCLLIAIENGACVGYACNGY